MGKPQRTVLVCANQRTGSTLLCRALSDTGVAGHPEEYFLTGPAEAFPPGWAFWEDGPLARSHGVATREEYLDLVYRVGSTPNGVFGTKLMWNNVPWVVGKFTEMDAFMGMSRADVFTAAFPGLRAVLVTRRDHVRQAVSWWRAAQDGVWVVSDAERANPAAEPSYDEGVIAGMIGLIEEGERGWRDFCGELGIVPHEVVYEDLVAPATYEATMRGVLAHLDLDTGVAAVPAPRTAQQADALNDDWVTRFLASRAD